MKRSKPPAKRLAKHIPTTEFPAKRVVKRFPAKSSATRFPTKRDALPARKKTAPRSAPAPAPRSSALSLREADVDALRAELEHAVAGAAPPRWNADPEEVQRSVAKLVLTLVEFLRKLMERQAIRRMDENTLDAAEIERVGTALMKLEETVRDIAKRFGLDTNDLNLDLGPIGKLM